MAKQINDLPPSYADAINSPIDSNPIGNPEQNTTQPITNAPMQYSYTASAGNYAAPPFQTQPQSQQYFPPTQQQQPQPQPQATIPPPPPGFLPSYGSIRSTPVNIMSTEILVIGGCPSCRIGYLEDYYSCLGILCAIAFFPIGVLCCLAMKTKRCTNCGMEF